MCNEYNGWINKQSWSVALWLDNDYNTYHYVLAMVEQIKSDAPTSDQVGRGVWTVEQYIRFTLADRLEELVKDSNPLADSATMYTDLLSHAIAAVDWQAVAGHYLEEG